MSDQKPSLQRVVSPRGTLIVVMWTVWPVVYLSFCLWDYYGPYRGNTFTFYVVTAFLPAVAATAYGWWQIWQSGGSESLLFKDEPPRNLPRISLGGHLVPPDSAPISSLSFELITKPPESALPSMPSGQPAPRPHRESAPGSVNQPTDPPPTPAWLEQGVDAVLTTDPVRGLALLAGVLTAIIVFFILLVQLFAD